MVSKEILQKVKCALRPGDQIEIAKQTGFSKAWVNQVLNAKRGTENEVNQQHIVDVALEIIKQRKSKQDKLDQKYLKITNDLLG